MRCRAILSHSIVALSSACSALGCAAERPVEDGQRSATTRAVPALSPPSPRAALTPSANASAPVTPRVADDGAPRVYAKSRFVWIRPEPDSGTDWVGYLWTGGAAKLKSTRPQAGPGCKAWYALEPRGFVCLDGERATLDPKDPALAAIRPFAPDLSSASPHRYGESMGLERYATLPSLAEQKTREGRRALAETTPSSGFPELGPPQEPPVFPKLARSIHEGRERLLPRSTVAYTREARAGARTFLLAADYTWVPKDRVKPYPVVTFKGVPLGDRAKLPLAFFRGRDREQFRRNERGELVPTGTMFPRLSWVELSGEAIELNEQRYLETRSAGLYVRAEDAVVPTPRAKSPWGALPQPKPGEASERRSWVEVSILGGWLLAYEGTTPVYATLISAGRGGEPVAGRPTLETASTPTGTFPVNGKMMTATMESPDEFVHSDVPWVQNFVGPYALHSAYWHDRWGNLMSAGCLNLSPGDAKWLFEFSDPKLPEGWHAIRWVPRLGPTTMVVIHA